jgi:hypothetical protein
MSFTSGTIHLRGVARSRVLSTIAGVLGARGLVRVRPSEQGSIDPTRLRRIALRKEGSWLTLADSDGFGGPEEAARQSVERWGKDLSSVIDRSVLTIGSDARSRLDMKRWRRGKLRTTLTLLQDAYRGPDGLAWAPAKVLFPWLPPTRRDALLRGGIRLVEPPTATGDEEVDRLLEGFDDLDRADTEIGEDGEVEFTPLDVAVRAITATVGLTRPWLHPWDPDPEGGDMALLFQKDGS